MLTTLLRSRAFALSINLILWVLLVFAIVSLGSRLPRFEEGHSSSVSAISPVPIQHITNLFHPDAWARPLLATNADNPFLTAHFIPPVVPPPPPPTTEKIAVTYHGFYQTGEGAPQAFLTVGGKTVAGPTGKEAAPTWFIAEMSRSSLVLTNTNLQTNTIPYSKSAALEVPVR